MRGVASLLFLTALPAALSVAGRASAVEEVVPSPVHVRVKAPVDCATQSAFWDALARKTDRLALSPSPEADTIDVAIRREGPRATGELRIRRGGSFSERRKLAAASCSEVMDGLSLVAALAFDPGAADKSSEPEDPPAGAAPTAPEPPDATDPPTALVKPAPAAEARAPLAPTPTTFVFSVGGAAGATFANGAGEPVMAWGGFAELERSGRRLFAPSLRLGFTRATTTLEASMQRADLGFSLGRASVCPFRFDLGSRVSARPCAGVDAGVLAASVASTASLAVARERPRPWVAPFLAGRLAVVPVRPVFIELEVAVATPLVRDEIVIDPTISVYRAPSLLPSAAVAAGMRFP